MRKRPAIILALLLAGTVPAQADTRHIALPYHDAPERTARADIPHGTIRSFILRSADSRIYPGIRQLDTATTRRRDAYGNRLAAPADQQSEPGPYRREVFVYTPAGYRPGTAAPLLVVQDGRDYVARVAAALDGLIAAHRVPSIVVVLIQSGGGDAQGSERGLEYDTMSGRYAEFVEQEVLPQVTRLYGVRFTRDPEGRATMGGSSGAAAAFAMAWYHPEWYRKVLSYSGTFVNQAAPVDPRTPHGAWDYATHLIPETTRKPIRVWMEVGAHDLHWQDPEGTFHNWPLANDRMAAALEARRYDYRYVVAADAGHVDGDVIMQTLPDALAWLWRDYRR
ncbi:alpha/beta hydrolase-fold protein [Sphingomonas sp. TREG-RG-20F-R18-01]|uniref:alpha/beta hydrolase n=1 Tax=Sphingomonas sp. TREG-RG-20F-R18-01 TaxID=2914982 RepID=UPI001F58E35A|nr:alpha/beta hydrolase-fold protein [Sphingomonas sp. TREG-RG-20F-R18-01]